MRAPFPTRRLAEVLTRFGLCVAVAAAIASGGCSSVPIKSGSTPPQSPQEAARRYFVAHAPPDAVASFGTVAWSGTSAIVRLSLKNYGGGGANYLAEHFPFGWQLIDYTVGPSSRFFPCELAGHGLSHQEIRSLSSALSPSRPNLEDCVSVRDRGSPETVRAVRQIIPSGTIVRSIRARDRWALGCEGGMLGCDRLFHRDDRKGWTSVAPGPMSAPATLVRLGVPENEAKWLEED